MVRWIDSSQILLIYPSPETDEENAYIYSITGKEITSFRVGTGVSGVLVFGDKIVVNYMDEGVFGDSEYSHEGVCVFTTEGQYSFGYQSNVENPVLIYDCYSVCLTGPKEVCFSPYPGFPLVQLNLETLRQVVYTLPKQLALARVLATDGDAFYFLRTDIWELVNEVRQPIPSSIHRWKPGETGTIEVGVFSGRNLRGHRLGTFLTAESSSFSIFRASMPNLYR